MCGFVGFTGMRAEREAILHRMADRIIHIKNGTVESMQRNETPQSVETIEW